MKSTSQRRGQALVMVTCSLIFLFAVMGLAVDLGWCYYLKARVQTAADAAATAAAVAAYNNGDTCSSGCGTSYTCAGVSPPTTSLQAGCLYATTDGPPTMSATLRENKSSTQSSGVSGNSPYLWVQATVSTSAPTLFLFGSGFRSASISASATSGVSYNPGGACVYILGSGASVLSVSGSGILRTTGCGIYVKSTSAMAVDVEGSGSVCAGWNTTTSTCAASSPIEVGGTNTGLAGPASSTSDYCYQANPNMIHPSCTANQTITDPLSSLPAPSVGACNSAISLSHTQTQTISPGTYCGGISVGGSATLTMNPGTYVIVGGGLQTTNSGVINMATVNGVAGVTIYNTYQGTTYPAGAISIGGNSIVTLSAPSTGTYHGILFMQDPAVTTGASFGNSATLNTTGTFYLPSANVLFSGAQSSAVNEAFVVSSLSITGSASLLQDSTATGTGTGLTSHLAGLIQ